MKIAATIGLVVILLGPGWARKTEAKEKFLLSMFHFNVQYVAGGLLGFPSGRDDHPNFRLDEAAVEDRIITESFEPVLDLYLAHPGWKVTLEMQAYMVEILLARHPGVLAKLKQLSEAGQAELVSFHYSDQLFLAYPALDLSRSLELVDIIFQRAGLPLSGVVFCQEGQFGVGMAPMAKERGRTILVLPVNLYRYQHLSSFVDHPPLFELDGLDVVLGARDFESDEVEVAWSFFDDGELLATGRMDPYTGVQFVKDETVLAAYEKMLDAREAEGFRIAGIEDFVAWARQNKVPSNPLPPMLDGTWQPQSTDSMRRWLGGAGLLDIVYACERDNEVLTRNVKTRHAIQAAEILVWHSVQKGLLTVQEAQDRIQACWREALLGQVTDATGINPFQNEVAYGQHHAQAGQDCAQKLMAELAPPFGGPFLRVEPGANTITAMDDPPSEAMLESSPRLNDSDGFSVQAPGRQVEILWQQPTLRNNLHRLQITASASAAGERTLEAVFPLWLEGFYLTPGLQEGQATYHPFADFDFEEGRISLPLGNGLLGLDKDLWLIKQTDQVHLAATFQFDGTVHFADQTLNPDTGAQWVFWVFEGTWEEALAMAEGLNLYPGVTLETGVESHGCQCGTAKPAGLVLVLLLISLVRWISHALRIRSQ